jgi:hypothetical protein
MLALRVVQDLTVEAWWMHAHPPTHLQVTPGFYARHWTLLLTMGGTW